MSNERISKGLYQKGLKRLMDVFFSFLGILLLSWLIIILMVLVKVTSKGPVLFKQRRIGRNKKEFYILKFRTMRVDTPKDMPTHLLTNPENFITPIGKFLRKTSMDELPQLINILLGDMSIVGPRPALWNQFDLIEEREKVDANSVRPGLTGLAQINGRDELAIIVKARYDGEYIEKLNIFLDIKIFVLTILRVLHRDGVVEGAIRKDEYVKTDISYRKE